MIPPGGSRSQDPVSPSRKGSRRPARRRAARTHARHRPDFRPGRADVAGGGSRLP
jgi:hypothetical protein